MAPILASILSTLSATVIGSMNSALSGFMSLLTGSISKVLQFHKEGIAYSREMGMSLKEANQYSETLARRTGELAWKYGVAAEEVLKLNRNLSEATSKALILSETDADRFVQINKLVGERTGGQFAQAIINTMGGQLRNVTGAVSKAYATAAKSGLNAAKFSEKVAQNLSLANKLSFRNGIDGITKMTALSEKLGFNMQSVAAAAGNFQEFDQSIENAAKLQMLGGAAGAYGSNPLTMMYEANYDPEAFTKRMTDALKGYATFNEKTGMADVNGMNRFFVKQIADTMGIGLEEAMSIAKNQATVQYKNSKFATQLDRLAGNDEAKRDFILNKSQIENGNLVMTGADGKTHGINYFLSGPGAKQFQDMYSFEGKSDKEIMQEQAETLTSIDEQLKGMRDSIMAKISSVLMPVIKSIQKLLADNILTVMHYVTTGVGYVKAAVDWSKENWGKALAIFGGIFLGVNVLNAAFQTLITRGVGRLFGGGHRSGAARTTPNWLKNIGQGIKNGFKAAGRAISNGAKALGRALARGGKALWEGLTKFGRNLGNWVSRGAEAAGRGITRGSRAIARSYRGFSGTRALRGLAKGGGVGIAGTAVNLGLDYATDNGIINEGKNTFTYRNLKRAATTAEYAGMGAMVGSVVPGLGTAAGGAIGGAVGYVVEWANQLKEFHDKNGGTWVGDALEFVKRDFTQSIDEFQNFFHGAARYVNDQAYRDEVNENLKKKLTEFFNKLGEDLSNFGSSVGEFASKAHANFIGFLRKWSDLPEAMLRMMGLGELSKKIVSKYIDFLEHPVDTIVGTAKNGWGLVKNIATSVGKKTGAYASGGVVGGNSYSGDRLLARVNSGELILNTNQQKSLESRLNVMKNITNVMSRNATQGNITNFSSPTSNVTSIVAKPVGEKAYIFIPKGDTSSVVSGGELKLGDLNVKISGEISLKSDNSTSTLNINSLLNDPSFVYSLKEMIKNSIAMDINGGRKMNDNATLRGFANQSGTFGKL